MNTPAKDPVMKGLAKRLLKKHVTTVVLLAIATGLATYVLVVDEGSATTEETQSRKNRLLPVWRIDDVTRVDVALSPPGGEGSTYTLSRADKGVEQRPWNLETDGTTYPAEEQVVDSLLFGFDRAKALRIVPPASVDRAAFGLDEPRARFVVSMGDMTFKIAIGGLAASQEGHYAELEGGAVIVLSKSDAKKLEVNDADLRSRTFVPYLSTNLDALWIEGEGGTRKFERGPWKGGRGSGFRFAEGSDGPTRTRVDGGRLDQVLVSLGRMQAERFLAKADADKSGKARVTLTMIPKKGDNGVIEVGGECPGEPELVVVVRRSPGYLAACAPKGILIPLTRPASEFVDDGMVGAAVDEISELRIERGDKVLDMARFGPGFRVRKPKESQIDAEVGNDLLTDIVEARGERAPADATMPEGTVTKIRIVSQGGATEGGKIPQRVEDIEVGPEVDGKHLVLRKEDGAKLYIGAAAATSLRPSDLLLRSAQVVDRRPMDILEMTVTHDGESETFSQSGPDLTMVSPKGRGLQVDRAIANRAMGAFVSLQATRWVADQTQPSFALDKPRYVVQVKLAASDEEKEKTLELTLGALTDDGVYATISGLSGVFLVPRSLEEAFDKSFVSREAFSVNPGTSDRIEIEAAGTTVELTREGRQLRWKGQSDARASELEKEILELSALVAVDVGAPSSKHGLEQPVVRITVTPRKNAQDAGDPKAIVLSIGAAGAIEGVPIRYARRDDVDATYVVSLASVKRIEDLVSGQ